LTYQPQNKKTWLFGVAGYLLCVGTIKGIGRIYQQTFVDTYSSVAFAKFYTEKTAITAADVLNDKVLL
jgi:hypothetical protein